MRPRRGAARALATAGAVAAAIALGGCATLSQYLPSPPSRSWLPSWLGGAPEKKIPPPPSIQSTAAAQLAWQSSMGGRGGDGFSPAIVGDNVYAAIPDGSMASLDARSGVIRWRTNVGKQLSAGPGGDARMVVVGTTKGEVLAFDATGKPLWQGRVSSEVSSPPRVAGDVVVVWSGDGRIFGLSTQDGQRRWVYQRSQPPLVVRNAAGGVVHRNVVYAGTAGGRLVAIDVASGSVRWEANVATPKGATELERIADVTSLPVVDDRQVCAVAYQGRFACFDVDRGVLVWSRDISSLGGTVAGRDYYYVTDDKGAVHALDRSTGASAWKQDQLSGRRPSGPQLVGSLIGVVDVEGRAWLLNGADGGLAATLSTDGTPAGATPVAVGENMAWLSLSGTVYAVGAR